MEGGRKVVRLEEVDSTNRAAMELAAAGEAAGTVVVARTQTAGRGRLGKKWASPAGGGLYFSLILRPLLEPEDLSRLTLAAGLGAAEAVESVSGLRVMLKWPNDLLLGDRKVGGILCESGPMGVDHDTVVIVGVGLNVSTPLKAFPVELRERATSLLVQKNEVFAKDPLLTALLVGIEAQIGRLERAGFFPVLADWRQRDATFGRELTWVSVNRTTVRGVSLGPDEMGVLRIRDEEGVVHEVLSGDLSITS